MIWLLAVALLLAIGVALAFRQRARQGGNWQPSQRDALPPVADVRTMHDCPRCGHSIAVDWAFCPFCARALSAGESVSQNDERSLSLAGPGLTPLVRKS
jgi:hypothetical protein